MTVIEQAERRLQEEIRQNDLGSDNGHLLAYWAAYLDGARAQRNELTNGLPKKGKWTSRYDPEDKPFFRKKYVCSACGEWNTYGMSDYCPKCGAEMEKEAEA